MAKASTDSSVTEADLVQEAEQQLPPGEVDLSNYVSKITVSTIACNPSQAKADNARVPLCVIGGIATASKVVINPTGGEDYIALVGQFYGENLQKKTTWRSGVCYLPGGYHENIVEQLEADLARRELPDDDVRKRSKFEPVMVQFALQFDSQPAKNPAGYSYIAKSLLPVEKADPLAQLIKRASATRLALPAPEAAAAD